jgi:YcaO-like protein with predicted kinase domain
MVTIDLGGRTPKGFRLGTHRVIPPSETLARLQPHLAELGITRVANVTELDEIGIPVVLAIRPNARSLSVAQGKGVDLTAAKVSALMESIEQHHAEHDELDLRWASHDELRAAPEAVVDPDLLPRLEAEAGAAGRPVFDRRTKILWTLAHGLGNDLRGWVPYELVHLNFTLPLPPGSGHFMGGSNGLASGNHPLEAAVQALTELVERDALALLYRRPPEDQQRRRIDPAGITDDVSRLLLGRFERAGVAVALWDATSDLGIPTILCDIIDRETNVFRPLGSARGAGCHVDPSVALARALTEAAQSRLTRIAGSRDDLQAAHVEAHRSAAKIAADQARILTPVGQGARFDRDVPAFATFEEEVRYLLARIEGAGAGPVLSVGLSRPDRPFSVLRVIVPGLEGSSDNPGYRPGRRARALDANVNPGVKATANANANANAPAVPA